MSHYYTNDPRLKHDVTYFDVAVMGTSFRFYTDLGVFSKKGLDFGTKVLLEHIELPDPSPMVIDLGCGYGPVGIFIAKRHPKTQVLMVDINERAVDLALKNARTNMVSNIDAIVSDGLNQVTKPADVIITNPPIRAGKEVVFKLYEQAYNNLKQKGLLYVVIQKKQGAPSTVDKLQSLFDKVDIIERKKGYWVILATK